MSPRKISAKVAARQAKLAALLDLGLTQRELAAEVGDNLANIKRDLHDLAAGWKEMNKEKYHQFRMAQLKVLYLIEESILNGKVDLDTASEWRGVRQDIAKLLGLNSEKGGTTVAIAGEDYPASIKISFVDENDDAVPGTNAYRARLAREAREPKLIEGEVSSEDAKKDPDS